MTNKYNFSFSEFKKFTSKSYKDFFLRSKNFNGLKRLIINDVEIDVNEPLNISEIAKAFNVKDANNANKEVYNTAKKAFDKYPYKKNNAIAEHTTFFTVTKFLVDGMKWCMGSYVYTETEKENLLLKPAFTSSDQWDTQALVVKDYDQAQLLIECYRDFIEEIRGRRLIILDSNEISSLDIKIIDWLTS